MNAGLYAIITLSIIHLFANNAKVLGWVWHGRFLSFAAGISFAYVFVDLLPKLESGQAILKQTFTVIPYLDRHAYVIALIGVLFFYGLHSQQKTKTEIGFWISTGGYLLFNFFMGVGLSDSTNPEIQPIILFTIAVGMHCFICDHVASLRNGEIFNTQARWMLAVALFLGYGVGSFAHIPEEIAAIAISFVAGGILLNVFHYELPKKRADGYLFFVLGSLLYTVLILSLGHK